MPFTEQDKVVLSDIVEAFTLAIVEVCQTLEHQRKLPLEPVAFGNELHLRAVNIPDDSRGKMKKTILENITKVLGGEPYPADSVRSLFETYDSAARKAA
jgi:hypothetical protein